MAELVASVKRHGIITPLTLAPDGDGGFTIVAGERRYRAAKAAKLREVPAQVREADGDALSLAVAENVIRADLSPLEEAARTDASSRSTATQRRSRSSSARARGWSANGSTSCDCPRRRKPARRAPRAARLRARADPDRGARAAARRHGAVVACGTPARGGGLPRRSGRGRRRRARRDWTDDDGAPLHPVAYSVGGYHGPIIPRGTAAPTCSRPSSRSSGERGEAVASRATAHLPEILQASEYDWEARQAEERRAARVLRAHRADARRRARVRLPARTPRPGRARRITPTSPTREWLADRLVQKIADHAAPRRSGKQRRTDARARQPCTTTRRRSAAAQERERQYEARVSGACAQPRPRRGARQVGAEARHRRGEAARLARAPPLRQGGGVGATALRRAADDDEQAGQGDRPLPARRAGREAAPRAGDRAR